MREYPWIKSARAKIGLREIKGVKHEPLILRMWKLIKRGGIKTDEDAWCAALVGACFEEAGIVSSRFESAMSYLKWGVWIDKPIYGCVVVFKRDGGGHVGFVVGEDSAGHLMVLGGNQGDMVSIRAFDKSRVVGYRWPIKFPSYSQPMPLLASATVSSNEA